MLKQYREDKPARDNQPTKIESEQERDSGIPRVLFFRASCCCDHFMVYH